MWCRPPLIPYTARTGACQGVWGWGCPQRQPPGEPAPAQWRLGGAQRSLGISNLVPGGKTGGQPLLSAEGKDLAGARQENNNSNNSKRGSDSHRRQLQRQRQDQPLNSEPLSGLFCIFSVRACNARPQQRFLSQFCLFQLGGNYQRGCLDRVDFRYRQAVRLVTHSLKTSYLKKFN